MGRRWAGRRGCSYSQCWSLGSNLGVAPSSPRRGYVCSSVVVEPGSLLGPDRPYGGRVGRRDCPWLQHNPPGRGGPGRTTASAPTISRTNSFPSPLGPIKRSPGSTSTPSTGYVENVTTDSGSPRTTDEDPQTHVAVPAAGQSKADTVSDLALTHDQRSDGSAEGGAGAEGPATDIDGASRGERS